MTDDMAVVAYSFASRCGLITRSLRTIGMVAHSAIFRNSRGQPFPPFTSYSSYLACLRDKPHRLVFERPGTDLVDATRAMVKRMMTDGLSYRPWTMAQFHPTHGATMPPKFVLFAFSDVTDAVEARLQL